MIADTSVNPFFPIEKTALIKKTETILKRKLRRYRDIRPPPGIISSIIVHRSK
jgi:hypothetical protein